MGRTKDLTAEGSEMRRKLVRFAHNSGFRRGEIAAMFGVKGPTVREILGRKPVPKSRASTPETQSPGGELDVTG